MIRALVFNLDGTLVETEKLKVLFYARAATELSPDLNEGEVVAAFEDFAGLSRQERRPSPSPPISPAASSATQTSWTALSRLEILRMNVAFVANEVGRAD